MNDKVLWLLSQYFSGLTGNSLTSSYCPKDKYKIITLSLSGTAPTFLSSLGFCCFPPVTYLTTCAFFWFLVQPQYPHMQALCLCPGMLLLSPLKSKYSIPTNALDLKSLFIQEVFLNPPILARFPLIRLCSSLNLSFTALVTALHNSMGARHLAPQRQRHLLGAEAMSVSLFLVSLALWSRKRVLDSQSRDGSFHLYLVKWTKILLSLEVLKQWLILITMIIVNLMSNFYFPETILRALKFRAQFTTLWDLYWHL